MKRVKGSFNISSKEKGVRGEKTGIHESGHDFAKFVRVAAFLSCHKMLKKHYFLSDKYAQQNRMDLCLANVKMRCHFIHSPYTIPRISK